MPTSIKLTDNLYWNASGSSVAVRTYTSTSSASSTHTNVASLYNSWVRIDCGGFDNQMEYPGSIGGVQDFGVPIGTNAAQAITFASEFNSAPVVVMNAAAGDGASDDGHWKDYAYTLASVINTSTTTKGTTLRVCMSANSGYRWLPNLWWIAVGK